MGGLQEGHPLAGQRTFVNVVFAAVIGVCSLNDKSWALTGSSFIQRI
jgi:hypothetical protein